VAGCEGEAMKSGHAVLSAGEAYGRWEAGCLRDVVVVRVPWDVVVGDVAVVRVVDRWGRWSERRVVMGVVTSGVGDRVRVGWSGEGRPGVLVIEGVALSP
jgi:hypothetical protein